jgi:type III secretion protein C
MKKIGMKVLLATIILTAGAVNAASEFRNDVIPWTVARVDLTANNESTSSLLEKFGRSQSMPLIVGNKVGGRVSGSFTDVDAQVFLDAICDAQNLAWFYDGQRLYVERIPDLLVRHMPVRHINSEKFSEIMWNLGFSSGPDNVGGNVKEGRRGGFITLAGVPFFVEMGESLIRELDDNEMNRLSKEVVTRHFRLQYASASDQTVISGGETIKIAGVARILQEMLGNSSGGAFSTGDLKFKSTNRLVSRRAIGLTATSEEPYGPSFGMGNDADTSPNQLGGKQNSKQEDEFEPTITANTRLNGVIIKDVVQRMTFYEDLIKKLDVPTRIIEIQCSIVDVNVDDSRFFSTEFLGNYVNSRGEKRQFGFDADRGTFDGNDVESARPSFLETTDLARGIGGRFSSVLAGSNWDILSRIKAMEEKGIAQVITSPMVLTEENRQASIRVDSTVYVRLQGERNVGLTDVTTGVQFRVTPSVVEDGSQRNFNMKIDIIDGSFTDQSVDDIPATQESAITTSANIPENRTLLLGGYYVEKEFRNRRQIPILGDIPVLGRLFGAREKSHGRKQRFFFLTPRLVNSQQDINGEASKVVGGETLLNSADDMLDGLRDKGVSIKSPGEIERQKAWAVGWHKYPPRSDQSSPESGRVEMRSSHTDRALEPEVQQDSREEGEVLGTVAPEEESSSTIAEEKRAREAAYAESEEKNEVKRRRGRLGFHGSRGFR